MREGGDGDVPMADLQKPIDMHLPALGCSLARGIALTDCRHTCCPNMRSPCIIELQTRLLLRERRKRVRHKRIVRVALRRFGRRHRASSGPGRAAS